MRRDAAILALVGVLAGCATSETGYRNLQKAVRRPDIARAIVSECIEVISLLPPARRERVAAAMKLSPARAPSVYCHRMLRGIASGRLTAADWDAVRRGEPTPNVLRVALGRS